MDDAASISGFEMSVPETIGGYDGRVIHAIDGELIQVVFDSEDNTIVMRKSLGTDDISGDYTEYAETTAAQLGELDVTLKGADGKVNVAIWTNNGYSYYIGSTIALSKVTMTDLFETVSDDLSADSDGVTASV